IELTSDSNVIPYSHYLEESQQASVPNTDISAPQNSLIMSMFEQIYDHATNWDLANKENKPVNECLTAKLDRYRERVKILEQRNNVYLSTRERFIESQMDDLIRNRNLKVAAFETEIDTLKQKLSKTIIEKESFLSTVKSCKAEVKQKEDKSIDTEIDFEYKIKELENIIYKLYQSSQVMHMLSKPQAFYDNVYKQALGYQNPFYLKKAKRINPTMKTVKNNVDGFKITVKDARALSPLDCNLDSACKYAQRIQEVLVYVHDSCLCLTTHMERLIAVTPMNKDSKVRPADPVTSSKHSAKFTPTKIVPPKENIDVSCGTRIPGIKVYSRRLKSLNSVGSHSKSKRIASRISNHMPPTQSGIAKIMGYGDYQIKNVTISRVYYVEGLGHNLFSVGQFCDSDCEVAFRKHTCFVRNLGVAHTPQQNGVVKRRNRTLVEAARTMSIYVYALLFLWAKAVATACYTQNHSIIRKRHGKTPYELLHDKKPDLSYLYVFGALCYPNNESEDLGKMNARENVDSKVTALVLVVSTSTPSLTSFDQDAPLPSTSRVSPFHVNSTSEEEADHDIEVAHMGDNLKKYLCEPFSDVMYLKFKMSLMGKLSFFLGLQISQSPRGIFLNQSKYTLESLKKYGMETSEKVDTPMVEKSKLDEDLKRKAIDPTRYCGMIETKHVIACDEAWVPAAERVKISPTNVRLETTVQQKEETFQVVIDLIKNSICLKAFTISVDVPEILLQ
nr:retrovirus-related Pol polyprotein from transposon TNT 1-94 [Tanacetum cinerariifolium]